VPRLLSAIDRQLDAVGLALVASWTATYVALWAGVGGFIVGVFLGAGVITDTGFPHYLFHSGAGQAVTLIGVVGTGFATAGVAIAAVYIHSVFVNPYGLLVAVATGAVFTAIVATIVGHNEDDLLKLRGYRRMSRDEVRMLAPHVRALGAAMELPALPRIVMQDSPVSGAWTHMRHIVLTTALIQDLDDMELRAVLAHELHHWRKGDGVAQRLVWAAGLPVALMLNAGYLLSGWRPDDPTSRRTPRNFIQLVGWLLLWPAWVISKLVIAPAAAHANRQHEYDADAAAKDIGLAAALSAALRKLATFEPARTGWEDCVMASHPPTALRIEALQPSRPDDAEFDEGPLGQVFSSLQA
jgi:Zn-dependent protease with chaperone function